MGLFDFLKRKKEEVNNDYQVRDNTGEFENKSTGSFDDSLKVDLNEKNKKNNQLKYGWNQFVLNKNNFYKNELISKLQTQYGDIKLDELDFEILRQFNLKYQNNNISQGDLDYMGDTDNIPVILNYVREYAIKTAQAYNKTEKEAKGYIPDITISECMDDINSEKENQQETQNIENEIDR